jgi:hypothetical protein
MLCRHFQALKVATAMTKQPALQDMHATSSLTTLVQSALKAIPAQSATARIALPGEGIQSGLSANNGKEIHNSGNCCDNCCSFGILFMAQGLWLYLF